MKKPQTIQDFPGSETADYILTYGYFDNSRGLTLEILATAKKVSKGLQLSETIDSVRSFIRIGAVEEDECISFPDEKGDLAKRYASKLEVVHGYDSSEDIERTRQMTFLDGNRHKNWIDDVLVFLIQDDLRPEGCWVTINGLEEHRILGILLNEPNQDFGCHRGDQISFFVHQEEDESLI